MSKRKYCGDLSESHIGEIITLYGWVNKVRDHGGVIFVDLRDTKGVTQVVFNPEEKEIFNISKESLINEIIKKSEIKKFLEIEKENPLVNDY